MRKLRGGGSPGGGGSVQRKGSAAGKRSRAASRYPAAPVQRRGLQDQSDAPEAVHAAAERGVSGSSTALPHAASIQESFGRHDVSGVEAHLDENASSAAAEMGASAFAVGNHVAFQGTPDLHTAAHEAAHVVQQRGGVSLKGGVGEVGDLYERHADVVADLVVRGESAEHELDEMEGGPAAAGRASGVQQAGLDSGAVQRRVGVNPVASETRHDGPALIGDGTPANPGLTVSDLDSYVTRQADWFTESTLTEAERDLAWKVVMLLREGSHMPAALGGLRAGAVARLGAADLLALRKYATCFDSSAETIQVSTPAGTMARALELGRAIIQLEMFVPTPVMRVVIPESGLIYLVDNGKIPELWTYYLLFRPTLETQEEWEHIEDLLNEGVAGYTALMGWVRDLHIFTQATRQRLVANVADRSRSRPVMLVLFSATDWNTAFMQAANMEAAILHPTNLALAIQGPDSIAQATASVNRVADDYGQTTRSWDWDTWSIVESPGRLGQVVIAGHGSDQSVEMASSGANPQAAGDNRSVSYDEESIDSSDPAANGTELLIDTVLSRMDPTDANIVFAGCLVGSHDIPEGTDVSGSAADAQRNLQAALAANPNLADYVRDRMAAAGITGTVHAANASTTFDSFNLDAAGRARLSNPDDPDVSGSKLQYLRTGIEPEGALRAALECYADAAIGPATTTAEMRTRVAGLAGNAGWWETITRTGLELTLPAAPALVDIAKLLDLSHRVEAWFFGGWAGMIDVQRMADQVKAPEAATVFPAMLTSSWATADHLAVGVPLAWLQHDAAQAGTFMAALTASSLDREGFQPLAARGILDPHLVTLLPLGGGTPTQGQLILALTIAVSDGDSMPAHVRQFLRAAAGGATTTTFPAPLGVSAIISAAEELRVLEDIGLAPSSGPPSGGGGSTTVDGNVDSTGDDRNDTFVTVSPYEATVTASRLNVRDRATTGSPVIDTISRGDTVRVMGRTPSGWSLIDHNGARGFVYSRYIT
jgi:hypothetical protein